MPLTALRAPALIPASLRNPAQFLAQATCRVIVFWNTQVCSSGTEASPPSPSISLCLSLMSDCVLVNERKPCPPNTSQIVKEVQKGQKTERSNPLCPTLNSFLSSSVSTVCTFKIKESPAHNQQKPTVPTPPRPHASPTPNLLPPPALPPMPASPQQFSPTPAAQPKQPTSTSPPPPMLPPPPPLITRTRLPTSQYTLTWVSVLAAYSCYHYYGHYGEGFLENPITPSQTNSINPSNTNTDVDTAVSPTSRIGLSIVTGTIT